ncbi:isocitrate lyase/PEP mutase family protein [uncultured Sphaerochaeta sp.]|uniref:isocitrate lyase/PEP mutase family protein n=1 Tax=uncultured Sphaerochaeta sp. TaxID=886478 RepID=UPI002A0A897F|nr:isocitrate lyase/PEP mutase family protein [uncultured Sphaerochaeta sp.]
MELASKRLRTMIQDSKVRIVPELHDCASAKAAEMNGFEVIMVSSGDLACALTGIPDLQLLSIDDFCQVSDRISNMTDMPLIIDADDGFGLGRGLNTYYGCKRIMKAGAAGVLVTDTSELGRKGQLSIEDAVLRFKAAREGLDADGKAGFLIARCDTNPEEDFEECVSRMKAYMDTGADMICILWMHKVKGDKYELCKKLKEACDCPMWYPDLCGKAHDSNEISMKQLAELGNYKLVGIHYSMHAAMLAMLDVGRHVMLEQSNDYVDSHFDATGFKCFTTMSMFGLTDRTWVDLENRYVENPQDSIAQRNYDYFVRSNDVFDPEKEKGR